MLNIANNKLLLDLALDYQKYVAGKIPLTSVDYEGSTRGYNIKLIKLFKDKLEIPIILNGGMGKSNDAVKAIQNGADAIASAYIFHFSQYTPDDIKEEMNKKNIIARKINK